MPVGKVDRNVLSSNYQQPGDIYQDLKTEGAFEVIAQQIDDNFELLAKASADLSMIISTGEYVKLGIVNVQVAPFNAKGDGVEDDTVEIQKAINVADNGSSILLPSGTFVVTSLTINKSVRFISFGGATIRFKESLGARTSMFDITANGIDVTFENIVFDGNKDNQTYPDNVNTLYYRIINWRLPDNAAVPNKNSNITVRSCKFLNTPSTALFLTGYDDAGYSGNDALIFHIEDNYFEKGFENAVDYLDTNIINISGVCQGEIEGNTFIKNEPITLYGLGAITISTADTTTEVFSTVTIRDNYFENYGRQGDAALGPIGVIDFYASCENLIIEGNKFVNSFNTAIKGKTNSKNVSVTGNIIKGYTTTVKTTNKSYGIIIGRGTFFGIYDKYIVSENIIKGIVGNGVEASGAGNGFTPSGNMKDVIVCNNEIEIVKETGTTSYGIFIMNVDNATIEGNILRNNSSSIYINNFKKEFIIVGNQLYNADQQFILFQGYTAGESGYTDYDGNLIVQGNTMRTLIDPAYTTFRCIYVEKLSNVIATGNLVKIEGATAPQNFLRTGANVLGLITAHNNVLAGVAAITYFGMVSGTLVKSNNYNNGALVP